MKIVCKVSSPTLQYAAEELKKYLLKIDKNIKEIEIVESTKKAEVAEPHSIFLIEDAMLGVKDLLLDDAFEINIDKHQGFIKGSNERSILLGVYKFLYTLGCRWLKPGEEGEYLPTQDTYNQQVCLCEKASYRHRGVVIEGANSYENVLAMIEWLPKLGYNSYFIQFKQAYTFFEKWYKHENNPTLPKEAFDIEKANAFTTSLRQEIKKRGLLYHAVGHGWTSESIGIVALGWDNEEIKIEPWQKELLAEIKGERTLWCNIPMNTNLCYSNPKVQEQMTDHILDYLKAQKEIDMLHVWLADDFNNHCECESCKQKLPTDFYIQILNLLDEKLNKAQITTKIVLLQYFELLWAPQTEKINNPERFIYMFAPISRVFSKSFKNMGQEEEVPVYERNKVVLPKKLEENVAFLREWQKALKCDNFDFDYHLGRAHYGDLGYYHISQVIYEDIHALKDLGLEGLLSCQEQRCFFPTSLPNYVMGLALWNTALTFEEITQDYFMSAFGEEGENVRNYLETLSKLSDIDYWHARKEWYMPELTRGFERIEEVVYTFKPTIEKCKEREGFEKHFWEYLDKHGMYSILFSKAMIEKCRGNNDKANKKWTRFAQYIRSIEKEVQSGLDVYRILQIAKHFVKLEVEEKEE